MYYILEFAQQLFDLLTFAQKMDVRVSEHLCGHNCMYVCMSVRACVLYCIYLCLAQWRKAYFAASGSAVRPSSVSPLVMS